MTPFVPIAMFGWIFFTSFLFRNVSPQRAVAISVIGGFLFLPIFSFDLPGIPSYDKSAAIALSLVVGETLSGARSKFPVKYSSYDLPIFLWCLVSPIASSLSNGLGVYDGISGAVSNVLNWGIFYLAGRRFFSESRSLRTLTHGIMIGGLLYIPLILFELRMSPQLSQRVYGFFPHSFLQHIRYGGYRPIVFMQHGLMVAFWMATSSTVTFWLWRMKAVEKVGSIPISLLSLSLIAVTVACKSANGVIYMVLGIAAFIFYRMAGSARRLRWIAILVPLYIIVRLTNIVTIDEVESLALKVFDQDRVTSLGWRLLQENLFGLKALERPWLGWGGYARGWPVNPETGNQLIQMVDSLWVIVLSNRGLFGLVCAFLTLGIGPVSALALLRLPSRGEALAHDPYEVDVIALSLVMIFFMFDSLLNEMISPVYLVIAGALVSYALKRKESVSLCSDPVGPFPRCQEDVGQSQ
jgi:hypothetical protein